MNAVSGGEYRNSLLRCDGVEIVEREGGVGEEKPWRRG